MQEKKSKNTKIKKVSIVGVIPSFAFQRAKYCALELHRKLPQKFPLPEIIGLLELDWSERLLEWRQTLGREYWCLRRPVAVFFNDRFIGSDIELIKLTSMGNILMENIPRKNSSVIKEHFRKDYISYLKKTKRIYCYLDICVNEVYIGTLTFQLFSDLLPRTCENFKSLCTGEKGSFLSYRGTQIHRIVREGWLQGGDIQFKTGGGGFSIFCDPLEDECFGISHDRRGVLSMANYGRHSNGSQFFITLRPSTWMDTHFVAFGQLMEGVNVLKILENVETMYECPLEKIEIKSCGKLDLGDVEHTDELYKEESIPKKKQKKIETLSEQIVRLIVEALTKALERKAYAPDVLNEEDIPSKMNLQLYFQGFYSIPEEIVKESAQHLRNLRRQLLRGLKPSATEVVEVITYDLLMAVLTRMTNLDDVRETVGHQLYKKMIDGIDMKFELCQKPYVRRLVDQIVETAQNMIDLIVKKMLYMKRKSVTLKKFQDKMENWVQSFVLQETFKNDNYHISDRPAWNADKENEKKGKNAEKDQVEEKKYLDRKAVSCCPDDEEKKKEEKMRKLKDKYSPEVICCKGSKFLLMDQISFGEYFKTCRYGLKRVPKIENERMPLLDLIEISRFKLRWMRNEEDRMRTSERICTEKELRKWMNEVVYTPEISWIRDIIFDRDEVVFDHVEEIMYGAMTVGLLEMYYFMEEYLKVCGNKKPKMIKKIIYPEDSPEDTLIPTGSEKDSSFPVEEATKHEKEASKKEIKKEKQAKEEMETKRDENKREERDKDENEDKEKGEDEDNEDEEEEQQQQKDLEPPPCKCGHPCCVCPFDPHFQAPSSLANKYEEEEEGEEPLSSATIEEETHAPSRICPSGMELVDLNAILAEKVSLKPEQIDIKSFKWLKPYILEKGCDLKTKFATQVHKWLEGESFNYNGFMSKHSLVTKASLLSMSLSLAEIMTEKNDMKTEIKNFVYDLWDLYFNEMFKEALLKFPEQKEKEGVFSPENKLPGEELEKGKVSEHILDSVDEHKKITPEQSEDPCKKIMAETPDFDFSGFCKSFGYEFGKETKAATKEMGKTTEDISEETSLPKFVSEPTSQEVMDVAEKPLPSKPEPEKSETVLQSSSEKEVSKSSSKEEAEPNAKKEEQEDYHTDTNIKTESKDENKAEEVKEPINLPTEVEEWVEESSSEESRKMPPYILPFWVKFLTELTKQALGAIAKVSRLPKRLYFLSESETDLDDKMKQWFEFNAFNPQGTKGREIMDYIALHHRSLTNLEESVRSYLKKKKYSELLNRCTRFTSAEDMAEEIVADVIENAIKDNENPETFELFVSNLVSSAITATPNKSEASDEDEENTFETDQIDSQVPEMNENDD